MKKSLFAKKHWILLLALVVISSVLFYNIFTNTNTSVKGYGLNDAADEAVSYLNKTSQHIAYKTSSYDTDLSRALRIRDYLYEEKKNALSTPGTSFDTIILIDTYENISEASLKMYNATLDLPLVWYGMERSIDELSSLNILKALTIYQALKYRIYNIIDNLEESKNILNATLYRGRFLDDHKRIVRFSIYIINDTLKTLREYMRLMEMLSSNWEGHITNNTAALKKLAEMLTKNIDMEKLKPFAKQLSIFITRLSMGDIVINNYVNKTKTENPGGLSGGYSGSREDD